MIKQYVTASMLGWSLVVSTLAHSDGNKDENRPFYIGLLGGSGSTTWDGLVPEKKDINGVMTISTPIDVREGGGVWGGMIGYELIPYFAVEANYIHYRHAWVTFDTFSIFSFKNNGLEQFKTHTETINIIGKAMFYVPRTRVRVFSSAGVANIHRKDMLIEQWHIGPTFGAGLNYRLNRDLMAEIAGTYAAGIGKSQLSPADSYIPFLYSMTLRLAYCF